MRVLVTGATGFVGGPVRDLLARRGHAVRATCRGDQPSDAGGEWCRIGDVGPDTAWGDALSGIDTVIHLAARAHVMNEDSANPLDLYRRVNRDGAVRLAEQAAAAGVRRMVFVSSIKVNGEATPRDRPFRADDPPAPMDAYGIAKAEAEAALAEVARRTGLELVTVRPPLVHGPGAKGNLATLLSILHRGLPLPLASVDNRRSLVGVANLADALAFLATVTGPVAGTYLVRDGEDVSTPGLIRALARGLGRPARLLPVPPAMLAGLGWLTGRRAVVARLLGSLTVDDAPLRRLGWTPPVTLAAGLEAMAAAWRPGT